MAEQSGVRQAPMMRLRGGLGLVMLALALAGCQSLVPKRSAPTAPTPEKPIEKPVDPGLPKDEARHRIALLVPLTGPNAGVGESIANAANMAVLDTGGERLRVTTYDTGTGAAAAAQRALADGNKLILGPLLSEDVQAVAGPARRANVPIIAFSNDVGVAGQGVYVLGFNPAQSIERVIRYARAKGMTSFAGLVPSGTYGQRASTTILRAVEASGGSVVSMQSYDRSRGSISTAVKKLAQSSSYDAIIIADAGRVAVQAAPLIRANGGANARLIGTELWNTERDLASNPAVRGAWFASVSDGLYNQLATKYRTRFGKSPYRLASLGYDAVLLATRIARDWKVGNNFPVRMLSDDGGFAGVDGAFRFGDGYIAERALEVQQIDPGRFSVIDAAPRSFGK